MASIEGVGIEPRGRGEDTVGCIRCLPFGKYIGGQVGCRTDDDDTGKLLGTTTETPGLRCGPCGLVISGGGGMLGIGDSIRVMIGEKRGRV